MIGTNRSERIIKKIGATNTPSMTAPVRAANQIWRDSCTMVLVTSLGIQHPVHMIGIARNQGQISACRLIRLCATLLPIPQRAKWDMEARRELFLCQLQCAANDLRLGRTLHA